MARASRDIERWIQSYPCISINLNFTRIFPFALVQYLGFVFVAGDSTIDAPKVSRITITASYTLLHHSASPNLRSADKRTKVVQPAALHINGHLLALLANLATDDIRKPSPRSLYVALHAYGMGNQIPRFPHSSFASRSPSSSAN